MRPADFIAMLAEPAQTCAQRSSVPASFTVAQAALESGWGKSRLAREGMNLFGVKADAAWSGAVLTLSTREYLQNRWVTVPARWRQYTDWQACLDDHAAFLHNNRRYRACFECSTGPAFARAVALAGYATDPQYATKLVSLIEKYQLARLDGVA